MDRESQLPLTERLTAKLVKEARYPAIISEGNPSFRMTKIIDGIAEKNLHRAELEAGVEFDKLSRGYPSPPRARRKFQEVATSTLPFLAAMIIRIARPASLSNTVGFHFLQQKQHELARAWQRADHDIKALYGDTTIPSSLLIRWKKYALEKDQEHLPEISPVKEIGWPVPGFPETPILEIQVTIAHALLAYSVGAQTVDQAFSPSLIPNVAHLAATHSLAVARINELNGLMEELYGRPYPRLRANTVRSAVPYQSFGGLPDRYNSLGL